MCQELELAAVDHGDNAMFSSHGVLVTNGEISDEDGLFSTLSNLSKETGWLLSWKKMCLF